MLDDEAVSVSSILLHAAKLKTKSNAITTDIILFIFYFPLKLLFKPLSDIIHIMILGWKSLFI